MDRCLGRGKRPKKVSRLYLRLFHVDRGERREDTGTLFVGVDEVHLREVDAGPRVEDRGGGPGVRISPERRRINGSVLIKEKERRRSGERKEVRVGVRKSRGDISDVLKGDR